MFDETPSLAAETPIDTGELARVADGPAQARDLARTLAPLAPRERVVRLRRELAGRIVFTHGFGIEGQLLFHWICEAGLDIDVVTLDTGRLFPETHELWALTEARYGRKIRAIYPQTQALETYVARHGVNGFYNSVEARKACCGVRKTGPLARALGDAEAWITGVRADQTATRGKSSFADFDKGRGLIKVSPLIDWTREQVLAEVKAHDVPINALHARGFESIGCAPCTRALQPGEPERNGRWWWEQGGSRECGLHLPSPYIPLSGL